MLLRAFSLLPDAMFLSHVEWKLLFKQLVRACEISGTLQC